jgi:hypothetical protein
VGGFLGFVWVSCGFRGQGFVGFRGQTGAVTLKRSWGSKFQVRLSMKLCPRNSLNGSLVRVSNILGVNSVLPSNTQRWKPDAGSRAFGFVQGGGW